MRRATTFDVSPETLKHDILDTLYYVIGKDPEHAQPFDWMAALTRLTRRYIANAWIQSTQSTYAYDRRRVYYLSMEFMIGRIIEDALRNTGLYEAAQEALAAHGVDMETVMASEPDPALGNGGLGGWPRATWNLWQHWVSVGLAMASGTRAGCSNKASRRDGRSRSQTTGPAAAHSGSFHARK